MKLSSLQLQPGLFSVICPEGYYFWNHSIWNRVWNPLFQIESFRIWLHNYIPWTVNNSIKQSCWCHQKLKYCRIILTIQIHHISQISSALHRKKKRFDRCLHTRKTDQKYLYDSNHSRLGSIRNFISNIPLMNYIHFGYDVRKFHMT